MAQRLAAWGSKLASATPRLVSNTIATAQTMAWTAQPHLKTFWGHARVELGPPGLSQWPQVRQGYKKLWNSLLNGKFLDTPVKEATRNTLVAVEVACWFFIGEIIGRKSLIGYKV